MLARAPELTQQGLALVLLLSIPALAAAALVGLVTGFFSAATQVSDSAVSFLPRLLAVALVVVVLGPWGAGTLVRYTAELWRAIPVLVR